MSKFFSEAVFVPQTIADHRELARLGSDADIQHKTLWQLFPSPTGTPRPFLYHHCVEDASARRPGLRFWILSERAPLAPDARWKMRSRPYAPVFRLGQQLRFELRMAPSVSRVDVRQAAKPGKQVPRSSRFDPVAVALAALPAEQRAAERQRWVDHKLAQWLQDKALRNGFTWTDPAAVLVSRYLPCVPDPASHGRRADLRFSTADFRGELQVTDVEAFSRAALHGLGHQRGFGCGLLLLKAVPERSEDEDD